MSISKTVAEFVRIFLPSFLCPIQILPPPTSCSVRVARMVVVLDSCGCTNRGASTSVPSYPVCSFPMNVCE